MFNFVEPKKKKNMPESLFGSVWKIKLLWLNPIQCVNGEKWKRKKMNEGDENNTEKKNRECVQFTFNDDDVDIERTNRKGSKILYSWKLVTNVVWSGEHVFDANR